MSLLRLDELLVEQKLTETVKQARALIMAGRVLVDGSKIDKAGERFQSTSDIRVLRSSNFVSRGGEKLIAALNHFGVDVTNRIAIDIGSSTGGFTDCLIQHGVEKVYCIDSGTNQLDWKLRSNEKVAVFEKTNARYLDKLEEDLSNPSPTFATIDVSFISVTKVLPSLISVLESPFVILLLVKPQFELLREEVSEGGMVPELELQLSACQRVSEFSQGLGLLVSEPFASPVRGQKKEKSGVFSNDYQ